MIDLICQNIKIKGQTFVFLGFQKSNCQNAHMACNMEFTKCRVCQALCIYKINLTLQMLSDGEKEMSQALCGICEEVWTINNHLGCALSNNLAQAS